MKDLKITRLENVVNRNGVPVLMFRTYKVCQLFKSSSISGNVKILNYRKVKQ